MTGSVSVPSPADLARLKGTLARSGDELSMGRCSCVCNNPCACKCNCMCGGSCAPHPTGKCPW